MLDTNKIKDNLITKYGFLNNSYLTKYVKLVTTKCNYSDYSEDHHLIPVSWYKLKYNCKTRYEAEQYANNDCCNFIVNLLYKDHCRAHYLLYFCTDGELKYGNAVAYLRMINVKKTRDRKELPILTALEYNKLQKDFEDIKNDENNNFFSAKELDFIKNNIQKLGTNECATKLNRPQRTVARVAIKNGWFSSGSKKVYWTEDEIKWLKQNVKKYSRKECAEYLGKTEASIHAMEQRLNISGNRLSSIKWSSEDDSWLLANYKNRSTDELIKHLKRSYNSILARLKILGVGSIHLSKPKKDIQSNLSHKSWTELDKNWLQENITNFSVLDCATKLNRSVSSIEHMLTRLNIKLDSKHKKWNK